MTITGRVVDASERFDNTHFDPRTEYLDHAICVGSYTCPRCGFRIQFTTHDLCRESPTLFSAKQLEAVNELRPLHALEWEKSLDFNCPDCAMAVRVIVRPRGEFAMGSYDWDLVAVVELLS